MTNNNFTKFIFSILDLGLDAYITPMNDEHLNEFVNTSENRVKILTGFTGTSGTVINGVKRTENTINRNNLNNLELFKGLLTDGRYFSQANKQLKDYHLIKNSETNIAEVLNKNNFKKVGIDPHFISHKKYKIFKNQLKNFNIELIDTDDIVGNIWNIKNKRNYNKIIDLEKIDYYSNPDFYSIIREINNNDKYKSLNDINEDINENFKKKLKHKYYEKNYFLDDKINLTENNNSFRNNITGSFRNDKIQKILKIINNDEYFLITELDTIAWIFNLRGSDIEYNLLFWSYAIISHDEIILFIKTENQIENFNDKNSKNNTYKKENYEDNDNNKYLDKENDITDNFNNEIYNNIDNKDLKIRNEKDLKNIYANNLNIKNLKILNYDKFYNFIEENKNKKFVISGDCNAFITKKLKNYEFTNKIKKEQSIKTERELYGMLQANIIDSLSLIKIYEKIVYDNHLISEKDISYLLDNYKTQNNNFKTLSFKTMVAINENSGDIHHENTDDKKELKIVVIDAGSQYLFGTTDITRTIAKNPTNKMKKKYTIVLKAVIAAKMIHKKNITGRDVDNTARSVVNKFNFDYNSATGHGIGSGLSVHEKFPKILSSNKKLFKNQVFSIEPGYYNPSKFGIRIEDDVFLSEDNEIINLTYIPYHLDLIDINLLNKTEIDYINNYHRKCKKLLSPLLKNKSGYRYLIENTKELKK